MKSFSVPAAGKLLLVGALFMCLNGCRDKDKEEPAVAAGPEKVYVANEHDGTISVIDAAAKKVVKTIRINTGTLALMAHNVQAAPDGKTVWVTGVPMTHDTGEQLIVIDAAADTILHRIPFRQHLHMAHIVFDTASSFAFVTATDASQVLQVNTETYALENIFMLGPGREPHGLRYLEGKLYVANLKSGTVTVVDVTTGLQTEFSTGGMTVQTAVTSDGRFVFASVYDTREVLRFNLKDQSVQRIALPAGASGPVQLYPTPDNRLLFVCDQGILLSRPASDKVYVIDVEAAFVVQTIKAGKGAHGVVVSKDGQQAFVTNTAEGTVSVIDVATLQVTKTIRVGSSPNGISYLYENGGMP